MIKLSHVDECFLDSLHRIAGENIDTQLLDNLYDEMEKKANFGALAARAGRGLMTGAKNLMSGTKAMGTGLAGGVKQTMGMGGSLGQGLQRARQFAPTMWAGLTPAQRAAMMYGGGAAGLAGAGYAGGRMMS